MRVVIKKERLNKSFNRIGGKIMAKMRVMVVKYGYAVVDVETEKDAIELTVVDDDIDFWNNKMKRWFTVKVRCLSMKHLVIFYAENGIYSAVYDFKNIPPTIEDIQEMQKDMQKMESLIQMPIIVNWLPISD